MLEKVAVVVAVPSLFYRRLGIKNDDRGSIKKHLITILMAVYLQGLN